MLTNVIVMQSEDEVEVWGCVTRLCLAHPNFSYHYLKGLKFPFSYMGWNFRKIKYNEKN